MQSCIWYFDNSVYEYSSYRSYWYATSTANEQRDELRRRDVSLHFAINNARPNRDLSGASAGVPRKIIRGRKHWDDTTHNERAAGGVVSITDHAKVIRTISITWA